MAIHVKSINEEWHPRRCITSFLLSDTGLGIALGEGDISRGLTRF